MEALPACLLKDVYQEALASAVIGIDEGQFVSARPGQVLGSIRRVRSLQSTLGRGKSEPSVGGCGKK